MPHGRCLPRVRWIGHATCRAASRAFRIQRSIQRRCEAWLRGISVVAPNYLYLPLTGPRRIVVDVGCASDADFSQHLIAKFDVTSFAIDPTLKHAAALRKLERRLGGRFVYFPLALSSRAGRLSFNESLENASGSLLTEHVNIRRDQVRGYEVDAITLADLPARTGYARIDLLKLDTEGAEFDILRQVTPEQLLPFLQVFVEFHHDTVAGYDITHTLALVERMESFGFFAFTLNDRDYLFWRV